MSAPDNAAATLKSTIADLVKVSNTIINIGIQRGAFGGIADIDTIRAAHKQISEDKINNDVKTIYLNTLNIMLKKGALHNYNEALTGLSIISLFNKHNELKNNMAKPKSKLIGLD